MNIVIWTNNYLPLIGGLERLAHGLALEFKKLGHEVMVVADGGASQEFSAETIDSIQVCRYPFSRALFLRNLGLVRSILEEMHQRLSDFNPDLINAHGWYEVSSFYQVRVAEKFAVPTFLTIHGLLEQDHYSTLACKRLWSICKGVNTVSSALIDGLNKFGLTHPGLRVIHNGSSLPGKPVQPLPSPAVNLLCVGRISPEKRFDIAIRAVKILSERVPGVRLTIVGGGDLSKQLKSLIDDLNMQDVVTLTGYVEYDAVIEYFDQTNLVLVPSSYESFGLVALEAALRGRPVIASNVLGLREVVADGISGVLVPAGDSEMLADKIELLLGCPELMTDMGAAGYARAKSLFDIRDTADQYIRMYKEGLGRTL